MKMIREKIEELERDPLYRPGRSDELREKERLALAEPDAEKAIAKLKEVLP